MRDQLARRAIAAVTAIARDLGLDVDDAVVVHSSNKLSLRLLPCDVFARVALSGREGLELELALAQQLAAAGGPVVTPERRVAPRVHERDGVLMTFWTFHEPLTSPGSAADQAEALHRLHAAMRSVELQTPHVTDRVAEAERLVADPQRSRPPSEDDRALLLTVLRDGLQVLADRGDDQVLHGEPHPGNLLETAHGLLVVDLETVCRGPVEHDVAHLPVEVGEHYPDLDQNLLETCRRVVLAMVVAWRWDVHDELPDGERMGRELLDRLRSDPGVGPPAAGSMPTIG